MHFSIRQLSVREAIAPPTEANGQTNYYTYDANGNLTSQTTFANYAFSADGSPRSGVTAEPMVSTFGYDNLDREISASLPNPTNGDAGGPTTHYAYDLNGGLTSETDPLGNVTAYAYDAMGNMVSLTDPDNNTTNWSYDHLGQTTGQSQVVALGYNANGTVHTTTATYSYEYDPAGNLIQSTDADGRVNDYSYDHLNEETGETWYANATDAANQENATNSVAYSYDTGGDMLTASNNAAAYYYHFDSSGNSTAETIRLTSQTGGSLPDVIFTSAYDSNGDRTSLAAHIGGTLNSDGTFSGGINDFQDTFTYNTLGQMTSAMQTGQSAAGGSYNGVSPKYVVLSYDADSRLQTVERYANAGTGSEVALSCHGALQNRPLMGASKPAKVWLGL